jgi:2-oxoglutarate dehydrogenase E2 component (dihydrolipoamide succinyltransferase)
MAEIRVPVLGESVTEATIGKWFKKAGDVVAVDEPLVELETDKVTIEVPAPAAGVLTDVAVKDGDTVAVGALLGAIKEGPGTAPTKTPAKPTEAAPQPAPPPAPPPPPKPAPAKAPGAEMPLAPSVRKLAAETGMDAAAVPGTGKDGRVTKGDMLAAIERAAAQPTPVAAPAASIQARAPSPPDDAAREERVRMTRLRQTIARRLKDAQNTAAMLTTFNEVDMTNVMALRTQYRDLFEKKHGVKLGFMGFFVRACVQALKEIPAVNAEIDGTDIIYKNYYHIGIAVGTERGLRRRAQDRGVAGRHLHHHQRRHLRLADVDADPQCAAIRHSRHAQDRGAADGGCRQGRAAADDVLGAFLRPPPGRRPRGGDVPGAGEGGLGGAGAAGAGFVRQPACHLGV